MRAIITSMSKKLYATDGVDVTEETAFSSFAGGVCRESYRNSPFVVVHDLSAGHFRGPRPVAFTGLPEGYLLEASSDGLGTKGVLIDAAKCHETAAYDLIAMTATDITRYGGLPLVLVNILDLGAVGVAGDAISATFKRLVAGLGKAAKEARVVVLKGETAQMGACVGSDIIGSQTRFNWGATMIGAYHTDKMVTGDTLAAGQKVIALRERGFRCNGISSVRKAFALHYGEKWWEEPAAQKDLAAAAAPSVLYDTFVTTIHGWFADNWQPEITLHAIVHLSGGGIKEKFGRDLVLGRGFSATLDDLWEPPAIMRACAGWRGMADEELYEAWNGGQGMLLVVDAADADTCVTRATDFGIEAKVCGTIERTRTPTLTIRSKLSETTVVYT